MYSHLSPKQLEGFYPSLCSPWHPGQLVFCDLAALGPLELLPAWLSDLWGQKLSYYLLTVTLVIELVQCA